MLIHRKTFPHHLRYYFYLNIELIQKIDGVNEENYDNKRKLHFRSMYCLSVNNNYSIKYYCNTLLATIKNINRKFKKIQHKLRQNQKFKRRKTNINFLIKSFLNDSQKFLSFQISIQKVYNFILQYL